MQRLYEKVGAVHIHTVFSDGSGHYDQVIQDATDAGLEFLLFSDHWTLKPKQQGREGFHNGILVGIGCELNDSKGRNHLLAFQIDEEIKAGIDPLEYTKKVVEMGGWAVVAHPDERRDALPEFPAYPWTTWDSEDFQAMEIWNHLSEWMERLTNRNKYWLYINPRRSVITPTEWTLKTWDRLNLKRRVVGLGGVDAHAHHYSIWRNVNASIFPYKIAFRSIHMHVLFDEPPEEGNDDAALTQLFQTLRQGRAFVANRYVGQARGFRFWAEGVEDSKIYQMGDRLPAVSQLTFHVNLPPDVTHAVLLKDSQQICHWKDAEGSFRSIGSGVYRVEARRRRRAFIFSNPIVIEP
ncbi:histidinol-phosphatase [candidate division LCP-89 bacterium B3_LCP]|uniref:Histidinol-phosphatase n=1 Tax=candidate division LCP-89 bacterium B3_LCP TaxID=2012998 RepID=A0A532V1W3_UNCL8|nr:MAG: histidinol-phosphatase [candidate division LCP-89 bacterium B3_LCP]